MQDLITIFCNIVKTRSEENSKAIQILVENELYSTAVTVLRFELDSMIRVLYLLSCDKATRGTHLQQFFNDKKWIKQNGKYITDRLMLNKAINLHGWASKVYDFACAFIHLSYYHDYFNDDPFSRMNEETLKIIKNYMVEFHEFPNTKELNFNSMSPYLLNIFEKINDNLKFYIRDLQKNPQLQIVR